MTDLIDYMPRTDQFWEGNELPESLRCRPGKLIDFDVLFFLWKDFMIPVIGSLNRFYVSSFPQQKLTDVGFCQRLKRAQQVPRFCFWGDKIMKVTTEPGVKFFCQVTGANFGGSNLTKNPTLGPKNGSCSDQNSETTLINIFQIWQSRSPNCFVFFFVTIFVY